MTRNRNAYGFTNFLFILCAVTITHNALAQGSASSLASRPFSSVTNNLVPVAPTASQFVKYTEVPVSEYTGIPQISVPLYTIAVDGVQVPIDLTYHAGGVRVNQEASWVGLGWDLQVGAVVQNIADEDDLVSQIEKVLPVWAGSNNYQTANFELKYHYCTGGINYVGDYWPPQPVSQSTCQGLTPGYAVATDYFVPIGSSYLRRDSFFLTATDSEPDVFSVSAAGLSLHFIQDFETHQWVVLDAPGFTVVRTANLGGWVVKAPNGVTYVFSNEHITSGSSVGESMMGPGGSGMSHTGRSWVLTKIITELKNEINFSYLTTSPAYAFPSYSERMQYCLFQSITRPIRGCGDDAQAFDLNAGFYGSSGDVTATPQVYHNCSFLKETHQYLSSVSFPAGHVDFETQLRSRQDLVDGRKLEHVRVWNATQLVHDYQFDYDYFDATAVGGNVFRVSGPTIAGHSAWVAAGTPNNYFAPGYRQSPTDIPCNAAMLRLKLNAVWDKNGPRHTFGYDPTPLPPKNSFAQDFWGYYNGQLSNPTITPNPIRFNNILAPLNGDEVTLGDNHANNSADLAFAKAGMLTRITYPTGGVASFSYGLNEFDNYWVPDINTTANTLSHGNGLRIEAVDIKANALAVPKRTQYLYEGGKSILPIQMFRTYAFTTMGTSGPDGGMTTWKGYESGTSGYFSSSPLASVNGVGYDRVTVTELDDMGNANGQRISVFYNEPDIVVAGGYNAASGAALPATQRCDLPTNGLVDSVSFFDRSGAKIKRIKYRYQNINSRDFYGARVFGYTYYYYSRADFNGNTGVNFAAQHLIGYYPITGKKSLQVTSATSLYKDGQKTAFRERTIYASQGLPREQRRIIYGAPGDSVIEYSFLQYPFDFATSTPVFAQMTAANQIAEVVASSKSVQRVRNGVAEPAVVTYTGRNEFQTLTGDKFVKQQTTAAEQGPPYSTRPRITSYDRYDADRGNLLEFHTVGELPTSMLWDATGSTILARTVNALWNQTAYTSFEPQASGRWQYDSVATGGHIIHTAFTGALGYELDGTATAAVRRPGVSAGTYELWFWSHGPNVPQVTADIGILSQSDELVASSGPWHQHRIRLAMPVAGILQINAAINQRIWIDEVRLFPVGGQMTSFTHIPLVGVTSQTNPSGRVITYEYDELNRLLRTRDEQGRILSQQQYHYARP